MNKLLVQHLQLDHMLFDYGNNHYGNKSSWPVLCPADQHFSAMSGLLKRKFEEVEEDPCYSSSSPSSLSSSAYSGWDSDGESCYSDTLDSTPSNPSSPAASFSSEYGFRFILSHHHCHPSASRGKKKKSAVRL